MARAQDGNQHWTRPGKDSGTSATFKDRIFYVFSSNAAPLQAEKAYSPFALLTELEYNGDFEAAARALGQSGFGNRVDINQFIAPKPKSIDPGRIPEHLFCVPGFISAVMEFALANAPYPNLGLAFCGAVALQSFLAGRKVCTSGDLRTNIYLLALASSGTGKRFPRKVNSHILKRIGMAASPGDKFASGEGIQDALIRTGAMLFQNDQMDGVLRPGGSFYIWGGYANLGNYPRPLSEAGLYFSQAVVWDKLHPVLTRKDFMGAFEICFYGWKEGAGHKFHGPNNVTDLWHLKKVNPQSMVHLTEKPVELAVRAIQYSSLTGDNVLDLFGGSGSTLIACEQTGRNAFLMELDTLYCDVIVDRWEKFTGKKATRIGTGNCQNSLSGMHKTITESI